METKQYKAGRGSQILIAGAVIVLLLFVLVFMFFKGWSISLLPPLFLASFGILKLYKFNRKPLFIISDNEIIILNPLNKIATGKIIEIREEGKNKFELILKDTIPISLFVGELSKEDRRNLKSHVENLIGTKKS
jgi:hypothetical protein